VGKFRILSLDGGGIRGLVTVILLQRLESEVPGWLEQADLLAGTSTGGLIALALAAGGTLEAIRTMYEEKAARIFAKSLGHEITHLGKLIGAEYPIHNLESELKGILGTQTKLSDLGRRVLIPSFLLDNSGPSGGRTWKPKLFHNFPGPDSDGEELAYRVGLYTAAAPTYFPSVGAYVDGGVYAGNPAMCALAQSQDPRIGNCEPIEDVVLLSLGTGTSLEYAPGKTHDWGYVQWIRPLIDVMLDGVSGIADYQCRHLLGSRYKRLAPVFPQGTTIEMDAIDRIPYMRDFASTQVDISETVRWIREIW
jgi:patatin-like phospholipase/acyl hydrolase